MTSRPAMRVPQTNTPMYSGGEGSGYSWTQTDEDIEMRFVVPSHIGGSHIDVTFTPRQIRRPADCTY